MVKLQLYLVSTINNHICICYPKKIADIQILSNPLQMDGQLGNIRTIYIPSNFLFGRCCIRLRSCLKMLQEQKYGCCLLIFSFYCPEAYKTNVPRNANMAKLQAGYLFPEVTHHSHIFTDAILLEIWLLIVSILDCRADCQEKSNSFAEVSRCQDYKPWDR